MTAEMRRQQTPGERNVAQDGSGKTFIIPSLESERIPVRHDAGTLRASLAGSVVRPLRLQRRAGSGVEVVVRTGQGSCRAWMVDVSASGVGLIAARGLEPAAEVELILPDGSIHTGKVRWSTGNRCGLVLSDNLFPTRPRDPTPPPATADSGVAELPERSGMLSRLGALVTSATDAWRRRRTSRTAARHRRLMERACRENGIAWLAQLDRTPFDHS